MRGIFSREEKVKWLAESLYCMPTNNKHCADWINMNLSEGDLDRIFSRTNKLTRHDAICRKAHYDEVVNWARRQIIMLGYKPLEENKSN